MQIFFEDILSFLIRFLNEINMTKQPWYFFVYLEKDVNDPADNIFQFSEIYSSKENLFENFKRIILNV